MFLQAYWAAGEPDVGQEGCWFDSQPGDVSLMSSNPPTTVQFSLVLIDQNPKKPTNHCLPLCLLGPVITSLLSRIIPVFPGMDVVDRIRDPA